MGFFLISNFNIIKKITPSVKPFSDIIKKNLFITEYLFNTDVKNKIESKNNFKFEAIDWEISTININGVKIIVPNQELIYGISTFKSDNDVNTYFLKRLDDSILLLKKKYNREDEIQKIVSSSLIKIKQIIYNYENIRINLFSKSISDVDNNIILLLAALIDCHNSISSSKFPWKITVNTCSAGASDLVELSRIILNNLPPLLQHIFKKKSTVMCLNFKRIDGPLNLINAIKCNNDTKGIEFNTTNERDVLSLYEEFGFSNVAGLQGLNELFLLHREIEHTNFIDIDRRFLFYLLNKLMPYFISDKLTRSK